MKTRAILGSNGAIATLIILITLLAYSNSLKNSFVGDDSAVIVENSFIKSFKNLPLLFKKAYITSAKDMVFLGRRDTLGSGENTYRPVVTLSYFVDYYIWKLNPFGYHLTNLLLHLANAILFYFLVFLIVKNKSAALGASLLFALHPVNSEAVNVISFREDLLAFLFFISSLIMYIKSVNYSNNIRMKFVCYVSSLFLFLLALFSKEMAVTLILIVIFYDFYFSGKEARRRILENFKFFYLGYLVILLFFLFIWGIVMKNKYPVSGYPGGNFYTNSLTMLVVVAGYIKWCFYPWNIDFILRDSSLFFNSFTPKVALSALLIMLCLAAAIKTYKKSKEISFGIFWFFITLLPVYNIFPLWYIKAARYLYIPIAGFGLFFSLFLEKIKFDFLKVSVNSLRIISKGPIFIILAFYFTLTILNNPKWRDNFSAWSEIEKRYPKNSLAHKGLGKALEGEGLFDQAIIEYKKAVDLNSRDAEAFYQLGTCYSSEGKLKEAIAAYEKAIQIKPSVALLYYDLANIYYNTGDKEEAVKLFQKAIKIDSSYFEAYNDLASTYSDIGRIEEAIELWNKAVKIKPDFTTAYFNLAVFYFKMKQYDLAIKHCDEVFRLGGKINNQFLELLKPYRRK